MVKPVSLLLVALLCTQAHAAPPVWTEPVTGMSFVTLPKGCFRMGTDKTLQAMSEKSWVHAGYNGDLASDEKPRHEVCVDAFLIGQHEVRARDWERVMGEAPPQGSDDAPAAGMTWHAAQDFAARLTQQAQQSGARYRFRLPTEAEWEYACRAGVKNEGVPDRDNLKAVGAYALFAAQHRPVPRKVGSHKPNPWGLHDMLGNVWEWVEDGYRADGYATHALYNPTVKDAPGGERVIRGASHRSEFQHVRCANRGSYAADDSLNQIGLRLVRSR